MITKRQSFHGHNGAIFDLTYDGNFLYSASADKFVTRWDLATGLQDKFAIRLPQSPYSIGLLQKNTQLLVGLSNGDLHLFDLQKRKEIRFIKHHQHAVFCICAPEQSPFVFTGDADGNLTVWKTEGFKHLMDIPLSCGKIRRMQWDIETGILWCSCQDGAIKAIETNYFNTVHDFQAHTDGTTALLVVEKCLFTGGKDAYINKWLLTDTTPYGILRIPAHHFVLYDLISLGKHNAFLVSASRDKSIKLWDMDSLQFMQKVDLKIGGHKHSVNRLLRLDDQRFVSCSDDKTIILWEIETNE
jgi:WD40 repeat protein